MGISNGAKNAYSLKNRLGTAYESSAISKVENLKRRSRTGQEPLKKRLRSASSDKG